MTTPRLGIDYRIEWNAESVIRAIEGAVEVASKKGAKKVAATARRLIDDKSGALSESVRVKKSKFKDGGYVVLVGGKGSWGDAWWAPFVELGTPGTTYRSGTKRFGRITTRDVLGRRRSKKVYKSARKPVKAHAYLRPALARNKRRIRKAFRDALK